MISTQIPSIDLEVVSKKKTPMPFFFVSPFFKLISFENAEIAVLEDLKFKIFFLSEPWWWTGLGNFPSSPFFSQL